VGPTLGCPKYFVVGEMGIGELSVCCDQSAVPMRLVARLASVKLALLPRSGTTSRTRDSEYLFWAEFCFHEGDNAAKTCTGMVNLDQSP
jgi:hypothetical protein